MKDPHDRTVLVPRLVASIGPAVMALGAFLLQNYDFSLRGVVPSDTYAWGAGYYLAFVGVVAGFAGAIWLIVAKHRVKAGKA
ncbi:hypothetical protein H7U32_03195 [Bifidobacterium pullorum subsp. saeculare]|uniref:Uncharacterized protein n=1 Tax=Bifidobacterium pullorum subsp. saeculare TaxID=78257 RepID=A0A938WZ79_9BIFI|nr:hypothetical protein [Bifidobacterium pullorum]MBM6699342.1 hypothetical protein [Bifidobacterium pullorum subsp. saeculare]